MKPSDLYGSMTQNVCEMESFMKTIGITGGVGAGKSEILTYLESHYRCRIIMADRVARQLEEPGEICYKGIVELLGEEILAADGQIDRAKMAQRIFADRDLLVRVNQIVHPAVQSYIEACIKQEKAAGKLDFLFIEAALLIECGYAQILDELWYIYASDEVRRVRLKAARGYSDEKIDSIMNGQLSDEKFRGNCHFVIDNSGSLQDAYRQIDEKLREKRCQK